MENQCIYKSEDNSMCCRSTSAHHCEIVDDSICKRCILKQETLDCNKEWALTKAIKDAIFLLENHDAVAAKEILEIALK